ncbi:MAG: TetR/AcrR family transcriptional regulator [Porcipelethomonas sp.]
MNKSETKYHNTALKMHNALIRLLEKKDFDKISIIEICSEAKVNRSTFYAHYANTYELLKEAYSERLQQLFQSFSQSQKDIRSFNTEESNFISPEYLIPYLKFVKNNRRFFRVYMNHLRSFDADRTYSFLLDRVFLPIYEKNGISDKIMADYMSKFYLQGITSVVLEWVNRDCTDDEALICKIITMCVRPHIKATPHN